MTSSHPPSMLVNMALVSLGRPLARTMRTHSATRSATDAPAPSGVMENATSMPKPPMGTVPQARAVTRHPLLTLSRIWICNP